MHYRIPQFKLNTEERQQVHVKLTINRNIIPVVGTMVRTGIRNIRDINRFCVGIAKISEIFLVLVRIH